MTSRFLKPVLALLAVLAASLAFAAPPAGLNWEVHGTGSGSVTVPAGGFSTGPAMPQYVGNATYSVTLSSFLIFASNEVGGTCSIANGTGEIAAANGSTIFF